MHARLLLSIPLLVVLTAFAMAFNPAPVYKEPPKPVAQAIVTAMQGTWSLSLGSQGKGKSRRRVVIRDKTWTMPTSMAKGRERDGIDYEILLDTRRSPTTLDLKRNLTSQVTMKGIVKVEGDSIIFCYTNTVSEEERPKAFTDTRTPTGRRVILMTLTRVEEK